MLRGDGKEERDWKRKEGGGDIERGRDSNITKLNDWSCEDILSLTNLFL